MVHKIVRTERLELVDRQGRLRAVLAYEEDSEAPSLAFLDADGQTRVIVGISWNQMPQIQLAAPDGTARVALVVRPDGMGIVVVGAVIGLVLSVALSRSLASFVFGVSVLDPGTFAGVAVVLMGVALAASYIPAVRATRVNPVESLSRE